jgi:hypothetical protein
MPNWPERVKALLRVFPLHDFPDGKIHLYPDRLMQKGMVKEKS